MVNHYENQKIDITGGSGSVVAGNMITNLYVTGKVQAVSISQTRRKQSNPFSIEGQKETEELKQNIINAVLDDKYVAVGLYGMGGIGKTNLLKHVYEHFRPTNHFEILIFITISAKPNFAHIRRQMARWLGCALETDEDDDDLKETLSLYLEGKKYLLVLDDMWPPIIGFDEFCIHIPTKDNCCKILMASRSKDVVARFGTSFASKDHRQLFQVNKLQPDDAWTLFEQKVGKEITSKPEIRPIAKEVVSRCDGLPLAIIAIGGPMSTMVGVAEWKDALRELKESPSKFDGVKDEVFSKLKPSFEILEPIQKSLFLYCCLFSEGYSISISDDLLAFHIGDEKLCGEISKLEDLRNNVVRLVKKLQNSSMIEGHHHRETIELHNSMLEGHHFRETVELHNVMRHLGLWITSDVYQSKFIVKAHAGIDGARTATDWCEATKISLMQNMMKALPELQQLCPQLHTLLIRECYNIKIIPKVHFLEHMPKLQILDLSNTQVKKLPPSISHLDKLRFLCLRGCTNLQELPPQVGKLVNLISLDLRDCSSLTKLPMKMKTLTNLRRLRIDNTKIEKIPRVVLSELCMLEELEALPYISKKRGVESLTHLPSIHIPTAKKERKNEDELETMSVEFLSLEAMKVT